jgi:predicted glycosyltransferase
VRADLGYGPEPLVVCSVGGTSVGRGLLELCGQAYPLLQQKLPGLHLVLVCGPRITPESLHVPAGIDVRGFVPDLYKHLAASDLAVVQGGGTTTLELTALQRPFIYFPLEGHCEQQVTVAGRLARHRAGIKMAYSATTPAGLADAIARHLGAPVSYPPIPASGADRVADIVLRQAGAATADRARGSAEITQLGRAQAVPQAVRPLAMAAACVPFWNCGPLPLRGHDIRWHGPWPGVAALARRTIRPAP